MDTDIDFNVGVGIDKTQSVIILFYKLNKNKSSCRPSATLYTITYSPKALKDVSFIGVLPTKLF